MNSNGEVDYWAEDKLVYFSNTKTELRCKMPNMIFAKYLKCALN